MRRKANIAALAAVLALALLAPAGARATGAAGAQIQVLSVDTAEYPSIGVTVLVRDAFGRGVSGLGPRDFTIEEQGHLIPSELLQVTPQDQQPAAVTAAIVADTSTLLGAPAIAAVQEDTRALIEQLLNSSAGGADVALFAPRSDTAGQQLLMLPFGSTAETAGQALASLAARNGKTDLYNALAAAINAAADRAAARGDPAYVIMLSNGLDRSSIVGADTAGANEAARLAEERHVQVFALGYGSELDRGSKLLAQLTDRAGGTYQPDPGPAQIADLVAHLRAAAAHCAYTLRFSSSLAADGADHTLTVRARLDNLALAAETHYLLPRPWDSATPTRMDLRADTHAYPDVTLWMRPVNRLRRTVPKLTAADFHLKLNDTPLAVPLQVAAEPLDRLDPAAAQSVALVVDLQGPQAGRLRDLAATLLQAPSEVLSRVALMVPGGLSNTLQFTHDHNHVINELNRVASAGINGGSVDETLLLAIESAARDGDAAARPAYVVLFTSAPLAADLRARTLTMARNLGVTIHAVVPGADGDLARLAQDTSGQYLEHADNSAVVALAQQIAADRATRYRITFRSPLLADGKPRTLSLELGKSVASAPMTPSIPGAAELRAPLSTKAQSLMFALVAALLLACAGLPRFLEDRKLRCPTCRRVRRAAWGDTCLFCAHAGEESAPGANGVPLEGFAAQGAALVQGPARATPISVPEPGLGTRAADEARPVGEPAFAHADLWSPTAAAPAPPLAHAQAQSNTNFWGPLSDDVPAPPQPDADVHSDVAGSCDGRGVSDAAPAPGLGQVMHVRSRSSRDTQPLFWEREQGQSDFWGVLPNADAALQPHQPAPAPAPGPQVAPLSNTDFWGPLPAEEQAPVARPDDAGPPPALEAGQQAVRPAPQAREAPVSHTDFWGPAEPAAAPR
jgi:hypothetical protein